MTVLPSLSDARGRGAPAEGEELHRSCRASNLGKYSSEEIELFDKAKEFLGGDFDERILRELVKNSVTSRISNHENILNELISAYFDRLDSLKDRQIKQVRFEEHLESPSSAKSLPVFTVARQVKTADRASDVIDLSSEDEKKQWEITDNREEQDVAKAIEASLKENQNILGFSPVAQKDPENPYERLRIELTPVGLKNIGNSCWFNVIIQTLFNIPAFRQMLLNYEFPSNGPNAIPCEDKPSSSAESTKPVIFIIALRRLFAFLLASRRSYIDPTETINVVNDLATTLLKAVSCVGIQQDCTEMLLRFTEWFEKAFEIPSGDGSGDCPVKLVNCWGSADTLEADCAHDENTAPVISGMVDRSLVEDMDQGAKGEPCDSFPQTSRENAPDSEKPLTVESQASPSSNKRCDGVASAGSGSDVNFNIHANSFTTMFHGSHVELRNTRVDSSAGLKNKFQLINLDISFGNLHDSFEAYHLSGCPMNELWYETAPPVIVFSLVRFSYKNGQTEKIHSRFHFPRSFYLDRYLVKNRDFVLENRMKRATLKKRRSLVTKELDRMLKYSVGSSQESVPDIIGAVLKFISDEAKHSYAEIDDTEPMEIGEEPASSAEPCSSGVRVAPKTNEDSLLPTSGTGDGCSRLTEITGYNDFEIANVTKFLRTFASDIQSRITAMQSEVNSLNTQIDTIFDVDTMMEECYRLHSVIIHEGEANVGHYWAYIADYSTLDENGMPVVWRKYNDKSVELATYEQMEEDAYGSKRTCSAYCIVYTRQHSEATLFGSDPFSSAGNVDEIVQLLPAELKSEVSEDNDKLIEELRLWNNQQNVEAAGPCNRPESCNFANIVHDQDVKFMLGQGLRSRTNFDGYEICTRHYRTAYCCSGTIVLNKTLERLGQGIPDNNFCWCDEMAKKLFEEVFQNCVQSMHEVFDNKDCDVDRRILMTEWARLKGIHLSELATQLFVFRMLSGDNKFTMLCYDKGKALNIEYPTLNEAGDELMRVHILYELYCCAMGVLAEAARQIWENRGTRELNRDIEQAKLVCFALRLLEKYWFYCRAAGGLCEDPDVDLILIALMMISSVHVSQDLVEYLSDTTNDRVLDENEAFLADEYRLLLYRLKKYDSESTFSVRLKTVHYVISLWEYLQRRLNSGHVASILEMLQEAKDCVIRYDVPPVGANIDTYNICEDLSWIAKFVSQAALREPKAMQLLLKSAAAGAKIKSLQTLPEEEVRRA